MSFFGKIFGGGKQKSGWDTNEAIQNLRKMEELLVKKQEFLEEKIDNEIDCAKKNGSKNKRGTVMFFFYIFFVLIYYCEESARDIRRNIKFPMIHQHSVSL